MNYAILKKKRYLTMTSQILMKKFLITDFSRYLKDNLIQPISQSFVLDTIFASFLPIMNTFIFQMSPHAKLINFICAQLEALKTLSKLVTWTLLHRSRKATYANSKYHRGLRFQRANCYQKTKATEWEAHCGSGSDFETILMALLFPRAYVF